MVVNKLALVQRPEGEIIGEVPLSVLVPNLLVLLQSDCLAREITQQPPY